MLTRRKRHDPFLDEFTKALRIFDIDEIPASPKNRAACVGFIERGNVSGAATPDARKDLLKATQKEWIGQAVVSGGRKGTVVYIIPKSAAHVYAMRRNYIQSKNLGKPSPFFAGVLWQGDTQIRSTDLENLKLA